MRPFQTLQQRLRNFSQSLRQRAQRLTQWFWPKPEEPEAAHISLTPEQRRELLTLVTANVYEIRKLEQRFEKKGYRIHVE